MRKSSLIRVSFTNKLQVGWQSFVGILCLGYSQGQLVDVGHG